MSDAGEAERGRTQNPSQFHFQLLQSHSQFQNLTQNQFSASSSSSTAPIASLKPVNRRLFPFSSGDGNAVNDTVQSLRIADDLPHSAFTKLATLKQEGEKDNHGPQSSVGTTVPDRKVAQSSPGSKRDKRKVSKHTKSVARRSNAENPDLSAATGCRYDSSLGLLTRKFVKLIQEANDGTLDLNKTVEALEVQKRRIYDITNVLEGVELIEKTSKNHIRWKGYDRGGPKELDGYVTRLKAEIESLNMEDCRLDECIREKQELMWSLEEDETNRRYLFLTEDDIASLPHFQNQTLIAINAPPVSYLEVPDPDEDIDSPQYKMTIRSTTGPIDVYLLSKYKNTEDSTLKQVKPMDPRLWTHDPPMVNKAQSPPYSRTCGIQRILPPDSGHEDDYWFRSDRDVSISELWGD